MNNNDYMDATARTETDNYRPVLDRITTSRAFLVSKALFGAIRTGVFNDTVKKHIFYDREWHDTSDDEPRDWAAAVRARLTSKKVRLLHHALGIVGEGGEIAELVYNHAILGKPLDKIKVMEECGDLLWYMSGMLDEIGFDFSTVMERNIAKLKARYPGKFGLEQAAAERNSEAERAALEGR